MAFSIRGGLTRLSSLVLSLAFSLVLVFCALPALAQGDDAPSIKVIKVKKNQAVVVFSKKKAPLTVGQTGRVVAKLQGEGEASAESVEGPSRDRFIGMNLSLEMIEAKVDDVKTKVDRVSSDIVYGWNKERIEYGVIFAYSFDKYEQTDSRKIELGGLFDYNFKPNTTENDFVMGARLILAVGDVDESTQSKGALSTRIEPGAFLKWFGLSTNLAALASASYRMTEVKFESTKRSESAVAAQVGIQAYF